MQSSDWAAGAEDASKDAPPLQTFEKTPFDDIMNQYEAVTSKPENTIELA